MYNDCVIVPGFGGFMAHHVEAHKDKTDGSFLPPIRSIGFNPKLTLNDSLLAQSYVETYDISYPDATIRIEDEVRELRQRIEADGSYEFKGIGTVSLNSEGNYEFSPCEAGILSPSLYGLDSFQMKTVAELKQYTKALLNNMDGEESVDKVENASPEIEEDAEEDDEHKHSVRIIALWRNVAVACIAIILFLIMPSPLVNNAQMAGTNIDTKLLDKVMPKDITTGQENVSESIKNNASLRIASETSKKSVEENKAEVNKPEGDYSIVVASHVTLKNASAYVEELQSRGFNDAFVHRNGHVKVMLGHFATEIEAQQALNKLNNNDEFSGAWVKKIAR